jgi:NAD(P)-dependent dehydrogenase (short-subunit alcohol dehydrogenase family)
MEETEETTFAGKVAVVTGGSRGMGREIVRAIAARGGDVVIASRKLDACEKLAAEISEEFGVRALPVACNVSSWDDCDRLVETVYADLGRVDVLVNNAGLSPLYPSLDQVTEALFDKVIGVNLRGPFRLTALVGKRMAEGEGGSIINVSSVEAIRPSPRALPYAAAKVGLNVLTEGFAQAFGPTVRVNTVQPGAFLTDISQAWSEEHVEQLEDTVVLRRCGQPEEIVGAVLYFAGPSSSYTTGATLRVDGGWR